MPKNSLDLTLPLPLQEDDSFEEQLIRPPSMLDSESENDIDSPIVVPARPIARSIRFSTAEPQIRTIPHAADDILEGFARYGLRKKDTPHPGEVAVEYNSNPASHLGWAHPLIAAELYAERDGDKFDMLSLTGRSSESEPDYSDDSDSDNDDDLAIASTVESLVRTPVLQLTPSTQITQAQETLISEDTHDKTPTGYLTIARKVYNTSCA